MVDRHQVTCDTDPNTPIEPGPQPDPMLSPGRASVLQQCIVAIGIVAVLTLVFYGLNRGTPTFSDLEETSKASTNPPAGQPAQTTGQTAQTPAQAPQTTGQAPQSNGQATQAPPQQTQSARPETPSPAGQGTR